MRFGPLLLPCFFSKQQQGEEKKNQKKSNLEETTKKNLCLPPDSLEVFFLGLI